MIANHQRPDQFSTLSSPSRWRAALEDLWRLNRVHAGPETNEAYRRLAASYPGTQVFGFESGARSGSWIAPPEWFVRAARLTDPSGRVIADWDDNPLQLYAFSPPFSGTVTRRELDQHLTSDPGRPDDTPFHFRNQYRHWAPEWGFCLPQSLRDGLSDGAYRVEIDTEFRPGQMQMAEHVHLGKLPDSLLLVGHFDHPYMCNDGLSGCLAGHEAISRLAGRKTHLTYRMLSTIEIIGSVFYAETRAMTNSVREALFVACPGARAPIAYQTSSGGNAAVDRVARHLLLHSLPNARIVPFRRLLGNDEVAFDVGGVGIPCGSFARYPFAEYHTDRDTPDSVDDANFEATVELVLRLIDVFENNAVLTRRFSGLPCLSNPEIDLYLSPPTMSGAVQSPNATSERLLSRLRFDNERTEARAAGDRFFDLMNLLPTMAEGNFTTLDLAERADIPFAAVHAYTDMWVERGLLDKRWINPFDKS